MCIDFTTSLCAKCIKLGAHKFHKLEEPDETKPLLSNKLDRIVKLQRSKLERNKSQADKSWYNLNDIENAKANISSMYEHIRQLIRIWRDNQLKLLEDIKTSEAARRSSLQAAISTVQLLESPNDSDVGHLIANLRKAHSNNQVLESFERKENYNFSREHQSLVESIKSVFHTKDLITSKVLE